MKLTLKLFGAALLVTGLSFASQINGSLGLNPVSLVQNGANLGVSTVLNSDFLITLGLGAGDYGPLGANVPLATTFTNTPLDLTDLTTFSFSNGTFGNFVASGGVVIQQTSSFLDVFVLGIYSGLPGFDATPSSLRISVNQSGDTISGAITLNSPALDSPVPEPATMAMLGSALIGLAVVGRKKLGRR